MKFVQLWVVLLLMGWVGLQKLPIADQSWGDWAQDLGSQYGLTERGPYCPPATRLKAVANGVPQCAR